MDGGLSIQSDPSLVNVLYRDWYQ